MNWHEQPHFAALDWARDHHDFVVIDRQGVVIEKLRFEHDEAGWRRLGLLAEKYRDLPVAVETSHGTVVENLFAAGVKVFPINPKAAERYRERHAPSGVKNDLRDAWSLADALRLDGHMWQPLRPLDPALNELRLLCRDEIALIEQRTQLVNQLRQALHEYYPVALSAFDDWTSPVAWAFVVRFPTPQALHAAGARRWESFMRQQRVWRPTTVQARIALFAQATSFCGTPSTVAAKSLHAVSLAQLLQVLEKQLVTYREHIEAVFARHPDHALFGSLPGAGEKIAPRLLAEIGDDRVRFPSAQGLQCHAGTAPVTIQSGKMCYQRLRHACNMSLRYSVHIWADLSRRKCKWAEDYYRAHRAKGHTHATALRCLGQRWLNILWKMWQTGTRYDEALHTRNQSLHGSWVAKTAAAKPT